MTDSRTGFLRLKIIDRGSESGYGGTSMISSSSITLTSTLPRYLPIEFPTEITRSIRSVLFCLDNCFRSEEQIVPPR